MQGRSDRAFRPLSLFAAYSAEWAAFAALRGEERARPAPHRVRHRARRGGVDRSNYRMRQTRQAGLRAARQAREPNERHPGGHRQRQSRLAIRLRRGCPLWYAREGVVEIHSPCPSADASTPPVTTVKVPDLWPALSPDGGMGDGPSGDGVRIADLNGDGHADLLLALYSGSKPQRSLPMAWATGPSIRRRRFRQPSETARSRQFDCSSIRISGRPAI